jgi:hypothetical protein
MGRQRPDLDVGADQGWEVDREGTVERNLAAARQVGAGPVWEPPRFLDYQRAATSCSPELQANTYRGHGGGRGGSAQT